MCMKLQCIAPNIWTNHKFSKDIVGSQISKLEKYIVEFQIIFKALTKDIEVEADFMQDDNNPQRLRASIY